MKILLVDNRDSFTFNLVDAMRAAGANVKVVRNSIAAKDALDLADGGAIMLSPGPGTPDDAGCCLELIGLAKAKVALIGVCLGHQAIVQQAGGVVSRAPQAVHGKTSALVHGGRGPFADLPDPLTIGRYHSLCTPVAELPGNFTIDAQIDGMAMAIRDESALQLGLQFHPESILTPLGHRLAAALAEWAQVHLAKEPQHA